MAQATIVSAWGNGVDARIVVRVDEGLQRGVVDYEASVALTPAFVALSMAEKKAALLAAAKAVRDAQKANESVPIPISGIATV